MVMFSSFRSHSSTLVDKLYIQNPSRLLTDDKLFEGLEERMSFINKILHFIEGEWSCDTADD